MNIGRIFKNKIILYLIVRYSSYVIQFLTSLVIAAKLGPYYLGIYGFITLIINYCAVVSFGIPSSLNVFLVHNKNNEKIGNDYIGNSLWLYGILSVFIILLYFVTKIFRVEINENYPIDKYMLIIVAIAIINYFNSVFNTVLRVRNKVNQLSVIQSVSIVLNVIAVIVVKGEALILALLLCNLLSGVVTVLVTKLSNVLPPFRSISIDMTLQGDIMKKGLFLFLYNSCFSFILISIRSLVSSSYLVEEFGAFTFSFSIANSVMLLLESLMTIIFPKIIDLLSSNDINVVDNTIKKMRGTYMSSSHFLIYLAMLFFPLLVYFMPKYSNALTSMNLIALAVLMNTNSSGYIELLIAKNKEKTASVLSMSALFINIVLGYFLIHVCHVGFSYVILATLLTYLFFSFMVIWQGKKALGINDIKGSLTSFFPYRLFIPYLIALLVSCFQIEYLIWLPILFYAILNRKDLILMKDTAFKMVMNPNIIDI